MVTPYKISTTLALALLVACIHMHAALIHPIFTAVECNDMQAVLETLNVNADALKYASTLRAYQTPLHCALSVEVAELLIMRGASVHHKDEDGNNPAMLAIANARPDLLKLYFRHKAVASAWLETARRSPADKFRMVGKFAWRAPDLPARIKEVEGLLEEHEKQHAAGK